MSKEEIDRVGLLNTQIERVMKRFPHFKGVIPSDKINDIVPDNKIGFIMNLSKSDEEGSHWVAIYISNDKHDKSVEYFDPFGKAPSPQVKADLRRLAKEVDPEYKLLFKTNWVQNQHVDSGTCGLHSLNFLMKRFKGRSWPDASGYLRLKRNISDIGEKEAEELRKKEYKYLKLRYDKKYSSFV